MRFVGMTTPTAHTPTEAPSTPAKIDPFPVNKTIFLGTGLRNSEHVFTRFVSDNLYLGDWARILINRPTFMVCLNQHVVDLVFASVTSLGIFKGANRRNVFECANRYGLMRCPEEVAIQLRLQYLDQPPGEKLIIATDPILGDEGTECSFIVEHNQEPRIGMWINAEEGDLETLSHESDVFVFVKPRIPTPSPK
jgi:hypothetical protein